MSEKHAENLAGLRKKTSQRHEYLFHDHFLCLVAIKIAFRIRMNETMYQRHGSGIVSAVY